MNVVGRVGSFISQGVYSVATPFHPFGGAVDVIAVQQQDGTFRSTPWYVRFGKFQGVLKGAEKIVRINVNGAEADFHMYLDNSGEAYFVHEAELGKDVAMQGEAGNVDGLRGDVLDSGIGRLEHCVSDSGVFHLRDEDETLSPDRLDRTESDSGRRYYEFQDDQSSMEGSVEFSEFGSNRFGSVDDELVRKSQVADAEVILVSVDGHILTAPVSASEQNADHIRLSTPQFHLGPAEGTEEFNSDDGAWASGFISELNVHEIDADPDYALTTENNDSASRHQLEVCEDEREHACHSKEVHNLSPQGDCLLRSDSEDMAATIKKEDVFKSCLELTKLTEQYGEADANETDTSIEVQFPDEKSPRSPEHENGGTKSEVIVDFQNDGLSASCNVDSANRDRSDNFGAEMEANKHDASEMENAATNCISDRFVPINNDSELKDGELLASTSAEVDNNNGDTAAHEVDGPEPQSATSGFGISLCGKELVPGMGLEAAAKVFESHLVSLEEFKNSPVSITNDENLIVRYGDRYFPWQKAAPFVLGKAAFSLDLPVEPKDAIPVEQDTALDSRDDDTVMTPTSASRRWRLWPIPFRRVKTLEHNDSNASSEDLFVDTESGISLSISNVESTSTAQSIPESPQKQLLRTNVPTSDQIASLNLKEGQNMITFSFSTRVLGKQQVEAHLYLWKWNARIVISDVDGTITKSDVLGQFMPLVGKDWSQSGVAKLFSAIKENGYQLLFLSARAIVQAYLTRNFLFNLKQDGKTLPNGPVVISPDGLFPSLYREVIRRAPHEFKIACLEDIRKLFPSDYNPFYAGFGNRDTDELSYRKIGIPKGKIFIINPKGEVAISHRIDVKSYTNLHTLVNDMFPPTSLVEQEDYNAWNFWRVPLPEIE